jgi:hypothetical protein
VGCLGIAVPPAAPTNVTATKSGTTATVTWIAVPVTANGGAPITGYTVTVTDPSGSGVPAQSLAASATTATFSGLAIDLDYTFAVVATNAAGLSSKPATASTSRQSRVTIHASDSRIVFGQSVRIHGTVLTFAGAPIASAAVTVHRRADSGARGVVATLTTDAAGHWSVLTSPKHNQTYDAAFAGDGANRAAVSGTVRVIVEPRLTIHAAAVSAAARRLVVRGHVAPNKSGDTLRLVALDSTGRLHHLGAVFLDADSTYRFTVPLGPGRWRLQVRIGRTGGNGAGRSAYFRVSRD